VFAGIEGAWLSEVEKELVVKRGCEVLGSDEPFSLSYGELQRAADWRQRKLQGRCNGPRGEVG
jgi:hypothetical protein